MPTFTILHTNDFHNHLTDAQAAKLKARRAELGDSGLLLDAGDAISSGNITYKPGGEPILDVMSDTGYDAMTVGNREFHFSQAGFFAKLSRAQFPILCANVRGSRPGESATKLPVVPYIEKKVNDARVAIFGLTVPMITERMLSRKVSSYVFDDPLKTADRVVTELRPKCDVLVCLSHIGLAKDRELAERVPGIDLIIGGHTHAVIETGEMVGETLIVQAGWWGKYLGTIHADISFQGEAKASFTSMIEPL
jgi:2',3'-cyclic-nucleotide 2'-phosphodiesterase (5'-nucleotidase family)